MGKLVAGVGINDADYAVVRFSVPDKNGRRTQVFRCPYYSRWHGMLNRCFNKSKGIYKSYEKTTVCEEWLTFSNFKRWMEGCDWEGKHLDKDLRGDSTLYSPETCTWIPRDLNTFIEDVTDTKDYPIPAIFISNRYEVQLVFKGESVVERVETIEEALDVYINFKIKIGSEYYSNYCEDIRKLYGRRKQYWLTYIEENREKFPVLNHDTGRHNIPKIGERFQTKKGYWFTVKEYNNSEEVIIEFDTGEVKSVHNRQIKRGYIYSKSNRENDKVKEILKRVDKYFKTNEHNLLTGIVRYGRLFGVSCDRAMLYYETIESAISARKEKVIDVGVEELCKQYPQYREEIEARYRFLLGNLGIV